MLTIDNIRSIGWLNTQTREQFDATCGDIEKMKELAVTVYSESYS